MLQKLAQPQLHGTPSKHASALSLIRRGLYDDLRAFAQLEQRISDLGDENTKIVGDAFEIFVEAYLATHQKLQADAVWLVGQVPLEIRKQLNLPKDTKGIDGVFRTRTGSLVPYQVKFRSQRAYLTYTEIAPFLGLTERATDRIVFTNSNELAEDVKNRDAMRTVRGIDFDDLTEDDFKAIAAWLIQRPVAIPKLSPKPYQIIALEKISETFAKYDRAHVVMACGTGKTLVALWAAEELKPKTVLVLVPSLTLLQQTLDEWTRHTSWGTDFSYICVCSDPTVASKDVNDPITFHRSDADFRVDTDPAEVRRFVQSAATSVKVIFSTYQSSAVVSQAMRGLAPIDIAIFDEAHKTVRHQGDLFAHCLFDKNIRIRRRLFLTATPRHYDIRHRNREGDFHIVSMDDQTVYGPRAYTLTFGSAAQQSIICNYKVIISVVDGQEVNDFALKYGITLVKGDLIGARWVANQIAVERAIEKTGAIRGITFHSRVSSAKDFSSDTSRGIRQWIPDFSVFHVNGTQRSSERKQLIRSFRNATKGLITNARCLTEGIDVPAVDMVAFIDPRYSRVDIAQATGRAMRKSTGLNKSIGYIVIPLFLERTGEETIGEALDRSDFADVANVLNAMQEQDEDLVQIIREIQEGKGEKNIFNPQRLAEKIEVLGLSIDLSTLRSNIFVEVVESIGVSWDHWYGILKHYKNREGHCRVPVGHKEDGFRLGQWVRVQRSSMESLPRLRRQKLDELGFDWKPLQTDWAEGLRHLITYKEREGDCRVVVTHVENGFRLGAWVDRQRQNNGSLSKSQRQQLDELGFVWKPRQTDWAEGLRHLEMYKERTGHCRVPRGYKENGFPLAGWVSNRRAKKKVLSETQRQELDELGFTWDDRDAAWQEGLTFLKMYKERIGHCRVPSTHRENGFRLGQWIAVQRRNADTLPSPRRQQLTDLGFDWNPLETAWLEGLRYLQIYKEREGHCRVPQLHKENGFPLGLWVNNRRHKEKWLSEVQRQQLDGLGFTWDALDAAWQDGLRCLQIYKEREGHCRVPQLHKENGFGLGNWVVNRRQNKTKLSDAQRQQLDDLGFVWNALDAAWEDGFGYLTIYKNREGHCRVPQSHRETSFRLGHWVRTQRANRQSMSESRRKRLNNLGFAWKTR
jgi:superfamily II DNA or RNA helicase